MNNLENFGVQELSIKEQEATEGGFFIVLAAAFILGFVYGAAEAIFD